MENESNDINKCPFHNGIMKQNVAGGGTRNYDWWPKQLKLNILRQQSSLPPYVDFKVKMKMPVYLRSLDAKAALFEGLYYVVGTYDELVDETTSMNFAHPEFRLPYNLMMSQVMVLFFFEKPRNGTVYLDYLGFLRGRKISDVITGGGSKVKTIVMPGARWKAMVETITGPLVKRKMRNIQEGFLRKFIADHDREPVRADWEDYVKENFPDDQDDIN